MKWSERLFLSWIPSGFFPACHDCTELLRNIKLIPPLTFCLLFLFSTVVLYTFLFHFFLPQRLSLCSFCLTFVSSLNSSISCVPGKHLSDLWDLPVKYREVGYQISLAFLKILISSLFPNDFQTALEYRM